MYLSYQTLAVILFLSSLSLSHLSIFFFLLSYLPTWYQSKVEGEIDLPCCIYLPCRRLFALLPALPCRRSYWADDIPPYRAARGPDDIPLHRVASTCRRPEVIPHLPDDIPRRVAATCRRCSAPPRRGPEVIPHLPDVIPRRLDVVPRRAAATCPTTPLLAASSRHHCFALTPIFARLPTLLWCVRSPILTRPA